MKPLIHTFLCDDAGERFFGEGPYRLLLEVDRSGSLRQAAAHMGMAYTKALKIIRRAEDVLGCSLIKRKTGGRGGGGSCLTAEAKELIQRYEAYRSACLEANRRIFAECFLQQPQTPSDPDRKTGLRENDAAF